MKKSIVKKVFVATLGILLLTLIVQLLIQVFIVDDFYLMTKEREIEKRLDRIVSEYDASDLNLSMDYYNNHLGALAIINSQGQILNESFYELFNYITVNQEGIIYKVIVDTYVDENGVLEPTYDFLLPGKTIEVEGVLLKGSNVLVLNQYSSEEILGDDYKVKGTIVNSNRIERDNVYSYQFLKLLREINMIVESRGIREDRFDFLESETGLQIMMNVRKLENDRFIITLNTIESLGNTFSVMKYYYVYIFLFQIILLVFVSLVYTRWFTKPLKALNTRAKEIANLDFDKTLNYESDDELEELADSLNKISVSMAENMERLEKESLAKEKNEMRMRELLANLSHEYKTPLGIISGFVEIMTESEENKAYYSESIFEEIDRLNELTRETLVLCETETIKSLNLSQSHDIEVLFSFDKFANDLFKNSLQLETNIEKGKVCCDLSKMKIVTDNVISNAIKYTNAGGRIIVTSQIQTDQMMITIKNTGVEIPETILAQIWDKYYRGEKSRHKDYGGNGLGLSIVKSILEAHGSIFGIANVEEGVVFTFTLTLDVDGH